MRRSVILAVVVFAATLGWPARAEVLIGMAGPMTGRNAWFGEQMERGAELAVADINAAGGVLGRCSSSRRTTSAIPSRRSRPQRSWSVTV
jgi:branched-chain amino acid transport system substrate-binding protein